MIGISNHTVKVVNLLFALAKSLSRYAARKLAILIAEVVLFLGKRGTEGFLKADQLTSVCLGDRGTGNLLRVDVGLCFMIWFKRGSRKFSSFHTNLGFRMPRHFLNWTAAAFAGSDFCPLPTSPDIGGQGLRKGLRFTLLAS